VLSPAAPKTSYLSWRRSLVAWLMGCALILGGLTPHAPSEEHASPFLQGTEFGIEFDSAAQHPREPIHLEGSRPESHPACPACLLHIQGSSLVRSPAPLPGLQPGEAVALRLGPSLSPPFLILRPARGPPVLSSSL
jgi:hypothetical protein